MFGDANANGTVADNDPTTFGFLFNRSSVAFDFNDDGVVNIADLAAFGNRFGVVI